MAASFKTFQNLFSMNLKCFAYELHLISCKIKTMLKCNSSTFNCQSYG